jgi:excisionase family DNA binding protein
MTDTLDVMGVAELLKASANTVYTMAERGELPGTKIGASWVFIRADMVEWLRQRIEADARERRARLLAAGVQARGPARPSLESLETAAASATR